MSPGTFRAVEGGYIELGQGGGYLVGDVPNIVIIDQMRGYTCFPDRGDTYLEGSLISSYTVGTDSISSLSTDAAKQAIFVATAPHRIAATTCEFD